ncbi:MAG: ATP-dependent endonuclease [Flavobacteriales bacterium CG03_land_8_20_14_0_80_35_15]|nr:AAA family ATPase [Zetaproteobacteria bacterium]OIO11330.1 MAG: ATP-dependent endonuclease [Flavobacteriaceae bacterium CG1_02_35_72]PIV19548.1 MAG: ATP-dependent endonuclease [Flavobacteriales bacterium CG03_land_8_20_14_0_80_35_15]PIX07666.1 MAG: ATP-dependent endonuclease [Flavobacteriales bacterium CG_4_8_14_3_um_filter_35_10]PJA04879.1 MAG: ATP-dependent endonuclease [Flavobacteriales bacterium CG_4_10_14_0_2_um_filter_35_18]
MINACESFKIQLLKSFPFEPTTLQNELFKQLSAYIFSESESEVFILKGYAGTGKTSAISTVVNNLARAGKKAILLAPTGRAAKVIANYANREAFTIHKKIYFPKPNKSGGLSFTLQTNKHTDTLFIVDECSMISNTNSDAKLFESSGLLDDLIHYVYNKKKCKLILIGDTAQLPPVKLETSPALEKTYLQNNYDKKVFTVELTEVMRQHQNSGILINATHLRSLIQDEMVNSFKFKLGFPDLIRLEDGYDIQDAIQSAYDKNGVEDTAFIVRSNKRANEYNQQIRSKIRGLENQITTGDYIMVVKNNYFWLDKSSEAGFIANGDICEILELKKVKGLYGFNFAEVKLRMIDYPNQKPFETVILLDTLTLDSPALSFEQNNKLYQEIALDFADITSKYKKMLAIKENKYFNALQVKFSYAMTCHKSQGGQWKTVFVEQPYLPDGQDIGFYRWLYTAITRAEEKLYLIGFKNEFFES